MDDILIEHIESHDFTPRAVTLGFARASGMLRRNRGYTSRKGAKSKRYLKRLGHKRVRQYFRAVLSGRRGDFHPVTGWDVL